MKLFGLTVMLFFLMQLTCTGQHWIQLGDRIAGKALVENFGNGVCSNSDGSIVAVSGGKASANTNSKVRVYRRVFDNWEQIGSDINGQGNYLTFGKHLAMDSSGTILAVSENRSSSDFGDFTVYHWTGSRWERRNQNTFDPSFFGGICDLKMSRDGKYIIVGACRFDRFTPYTEFVGSILVFEWTGTKYEQKGSRMEGDKYYEGFGFSAAISNDGNTIAGGAPSSDVPDDETGLVRTYRWTNNDWEQIGPTLVGDYSGHRLGSDLDLNDEGNILAISGVNNVQNGDNKGITRVYELNSNNWIQKGSTLSIDNYGDNAGYSIVLNKTGNILAIGAPLNNEYDQYTGKIRCFKWNDNDWEIYGNDMVGIKYNDYLGWTIDMDDAGTTIISSYRNNFSLGGGVVYSYGRRPDSKLEDLIKWSYNHPDFTVSFEEELEAMTVSIYNVMGQLLYKSEKKKYRSLSFPLNVRNGIYILKVVLDNGEEATLKMKL